MRTHVAVIIEIEHDGTLTPDEMAKTVGAWVELVPIYHRSIETESADGVTTDVTIIAARASAPITKD